MSGPKLKIARTPAQPPYLPLSSSGGLVQSGGFASKASGSLPGPIRGVVVNVAIGVGDTMADSDGALREIVDSR